MTGIRYISHTGTFGYAEAARRYIVGLARAGIPVTWTPVVHTNAAGTEFDLFGGTRVGDRKLDPFCNRQIAYDTVIVHVLPRAVPHCRQCVSAKTVVGYATWETNQLPDGWASMYDAFDALLVPCSWNRTVFRRGGVQAPIHVVPHLFAEQASGEESLVSHEAQDEFLFYTIGTWTPRKGMEELVVAYLKAFTDRDQVKLIIKTDVAGISSGSLLRASMRRVLRRIRPANTLLLQRIRRLFWLSSVKRIKTSIRVGAALRGCPHAPKIELVTGDVPERKIRQIHKAGGCFVSLSKGEGWGLGAFDAAGHGNPVIITGVGGPLDYLDKDSAYLLDYRLERVRDDSVQEWSSLGHHWAALDIEHAALTMRHVYTHRKEASRKGGLLQKRILENYNEKVIIQRLMKTLSQ